MVDRRRLLQGSLRACAGAWGLPAQAAAAASPARPAPVPVAAATSGLAAWRSGRRRGFTSRHLRDLDLATMASARGVGAEHLRCGLVAGNSGPGDHRFDAADIERAEWCLAEAGRIGLNLVVAAFVDDGGTQRLWDQPDLRERLQRSWVSAARRLARWPALAGLDLLNEPLPPGRGLAQAQREWSALAMRLVPALREAGVRQTLLLQPPAGGGPLGFRQLDPPALLLQDAALVWSLHFYGPHPITHQGVSPTWPGRFHYPSRDGERVAGTDPDTPPVAFDAARLALELAPADSFQRRHGATLHVGEFGCVRWAPDGSALRWVRDALDLIQARRWGFSFHSWRTWEGWDPELDGEDAATARRHADAPMLQMLRRSWAGGA